MLLGLIALALVDSINPSAIVVTLYLLAGGRAPARNRMTARLRQLGSLRAGVTSVTAMVD